MIDENRKQEAQSNFRHYLEDGLLRKERNEVARAMYLKNADLSLRLAEEISHSRLRPHLWTIVVSYYSMFYMANAVLLHLGYKTGRKVVHKVTSDALIVLVLDRLEAGLLEEYESIREDALEIASIRSESLLADYERELRKRSDFQYEMAAQVQEKMAATSLRRAKEFLLEMRKLMHEGASDVKQDKRA